MALAARDQSTSPSPIYTGIVNDLGVKTLREICDILAIPTREADDTGKVLTKGVLVPKIQEVLSKDSQTYASDPRFAGLYQAAVKGKNVKGKAAKADLVLHQRNTTVDPLGSLFALRIKKSDGKPQVASMSTKSLSPIPPPAISDSDEEEEEPSNKGKKKASTTTSEHTVYVMLKDPRDPTKLPEEVPSDGMVPVTLYITPGGTEWHEVKLTQLMSATINMYSPMRSDLHGQLSRLNHKGTSTTHLGTIAQQITNQIPDRAKLDRTNIFTLAVTEDGDLLCEIFMSLRYLPDKMGKGKASNPNADMHAPESLSPAHHPLPPAAQTTLTGAGTDLPLHIAQNRERTPEEHRYKEDDKDFLREASGDPDKLKQPKNTTAAEGLDNFREYNSFFKGFLSFEHNKGKGYIVSPYYQPPSDIENWQRHRNTTFTKNHITCAAGLKPSSTGENHSLRDKGGIGNEKIQGYEAEYDDMDYGRLEKKNSKKPSGSKHHRRVESSDKDEPRRKKEKKGRKDQTKKKPKVSSSKATELNSDDLDNSDDSSSDSDN
ncbi:hypothetical protein R3P38DRAFT_2895709 [Favolaschia claudopus]|uniref:Uncharacterized protein n=1 Tax=Favolaschia claudopus TaxID=2862362 RepID=A0AAW0CNG7_9AGAR